MDFDLLSIVDSKFRQSDIDGAVSLLEELLKSEKRDRFSSLIGAYFTNPPHQVSAFINQFIVDCEKDFSVKAVYLEMNGFDINYDVWYFSPFAYPNYTPGYDNLDWLADCQSDEMYDDMILTGLERVQADYAWYCEEKGEDDERYYRSHELATILVMVKFVALIQAALASSPLVKPVPVLATAHDFCTFGHFVPVARV